MNHRHVSQIEADLDEATSQVRQLKDDLQKKQTYIMKLEADAIGNAVCNSQQMSTQNVYDNVLLWSMCCYNLFNIWQTDKFKLFFIFQRN